MILKCPVTYSNNLASSHCSKSPAFLKTYCIYPLVIGDFLSRFLWPTFFWNFHSNNVIAMADDKKNWNIRLCNFLQQPNVWKVQYLLIAMACCQFCFWVNKWWILSLFLFFVVGGGQDYTTFYNRQIFERLNI